MDRANVRRGLSHEQVSAVISSISAVDVADVGQTPDNLGNRFQRSYASGEVEYGLRRQTRHSSAAHVLYVGKKIATGKLHLLTCVCGKCSPARMVLYHLHRVSFQSDHGSVAQHLR